MWRSVPLPILLAAALAAPAHAGGTPGAIEASEKGGTLVITGDALDNGVILRARATPGTIVVEGFAGTLVNGAASVEFAGISKGLRADLGEGHDTLMLTAVGPDGLQAPMLLPRKVALAMGEGVDIVVFDNTLAPGKLSLDLGGGLDVVAGHDCVFLGGVKLAGGDGDDAVALDRCTLPGKLKLDLGPGDDRLVTFLSELSGKAALKLGDGADLFGITGGVIATGTKLDGGLGFDSALEDDFTLVGLKVKNLEDATLVGELDVAALFTDYPPAAQAIDMLEDEGSL